MKKYVYIMLTMVLFLSSCAGEFNKVFKSQDYDYRYWKLLKANISVPSPFFKT